MDEKDNYMSFKRERETPVDCYTRSEVDGKLKALETRCNDNIKNAKAEINKSLDNSWEEVKKHFNNAEEKASSRANNRYTKEESDKKINDTNARLNALTAAVNKFEEWAEYVSSVIGNDKKHFWQFWK